MSRTHVFSGVTMQKEKKTAQELADMIQAEINVAGTFVKVHPDKVYGWHPTVFAAPQNAGALQMEAERIAAQLRTKYELNPADPPPLNMISNKKTGQLGPRPLRHHRRRRPIKTVPIAYTASVGKRNPR